jgi:hypothetical protein
MIQHKRLQRQIERIGQRSQWHLAERWYRIYLGIQKRFNWCDNQSLNDAIERLRVAIETAKRTNARKEAMKDPKVIRAQEAVSGLMLRLLKSVPPERVLTAHGKSA